MKPATSARPRRPSREPGPGNPYETVCSEAFVKAAESPGLTSPPLLDHKLAGQVSGATNPRKGEREALEEVQAACRDLARLRDVDEIAELALGLSLSLTKSAVAFMGLTDQSGSYEHVYSRSADASRSTPPDEAERLVSGGVSSSNPAVCARLLEVAGETVGMIGVARELNYAPLHRNVLGILASQIAASEQNAQLRTRSQEMADQLVNLPAALLRTHNERPLTRG